MNRAARGWTASDAAELLREPTASDDKYSRGVLGIRTGSTAYPGAAVLGVEAAWRTGLGMVRYVGPPRAADLVLSRRPETVVAEGRVQAWLIGSGTDADDRSDEEARALDGILQGTVPVVVDAGALDLAPDAAAPIVVTPHEREHEKLRALLGLRSRGSRAEATAETAEALGACVVLKGAETVVAVPSGWSVTLPHATPWLATAGTGDVLAGAIGAVIAARAAAAELDVEALGPLAATGAWLHADAARRAVRAAGGGPVTALDVAGELARAVGALHRPE
ncbi:MAG: NAD(P)H-hydrate dehydratase [Candidatus Microbacterium phytovorans]|uniref:ADP-dependent (S)-NAD(P)H-hydrate dehydratase n=1 Tax=Candidatus Microbacterium phytovorans TaxID=3121374 RepID=A0AAJ5W2Y6_9MICO|nr:ADP/ATP-dependent (S)-NAD(P)H-hydrate dehydratase [Microbacterium sp.]WEK13858.1 MAG: NAD(P)H-hydrate dehydratase [Microbacterium sp.]